MEYFTRISTILFLLVTGCYANTSGLNLKNGSSPVLLYAKGLSSLKSGDYDVATEAFDAVLRQPAKAVGNFYLLTTLRSGDLLFAQAHYAQAQVRYKRVIDSVQGQTQLPNIDYALFRLAQSHWMAKGESFFLVPPVDRRDQSEVNAAYRLTSRFITEYPNSPYINDVISLHKKIVNTKISFEMEVARFYMVRHKPLGAISRLEWLLDKVPDSRHNKRVVRMYLKALKIAGKKDVMQRKCIEFQDVLGKSVCKG